MLHFSVESGQ